MTNPYAARGVVKEWAAVDYYGGQRHVRRRFWHRWQARLWALGVYAVERDGELPR